MIARIGRKGQVMAAKKDDRARNWTFILYPESAPDDWEMKLAELCIPCAVSPLHQYDVNPTGELKKPHYHILLAFEGNKSYSQVLEISQFFNATIPQKVESMRGMVRYLVHMDNPEKFQYDKSEIKNFGGFCAADYLVLSSFQEINIIAEIEDYIEECNITEFWDLARACRKEHFDDWYPVVTRKATVYFKALVTSRRHKLDGGSAKQICRKLDETF